MSVINADLPEKFDPSHPAIQGQSRSLELTRTDLLPVTATVTVTTGLSRTISKINGNFGQKSYNIPTHHVFHAPAEGVPSEFCNGGSAKKKWCHADGCAITCSVCSSMLMRDTNATMDRTHPYPIIISMSI